MKTIAIILAAFIGLTAHAAGLVGTNYAALSTGASDPHNPFTHQTLISAGAAGNYAVLPYLDVGAIATDSRLPSQQFDLSATTAQLEATLHAPLPYVTPYVTLGAGWAVDKLNGANYHGVTNFAAGGIEAFQDRNAVAARAQPDCRRQPPEAAADDHRMRAPVRLRGGKDIRAGRRMCKYIHDTASVTLTGHLPTSPRRFASRRAN